MQDEYGVAFEFMFRFVESFYENSPDNDDVMLIYKKFFQVREELRHDCL